MQDSDNRKRSWPRGSLERVLSRDFPGCSTALEALKKKLSNPQIETAAQEPLLSREDLSLKNAIKEIEEAQKDLDMDKISLPMRDRLAKMPLTTLSEIGLWRDLWLSTIDKLKW